MKTAMQKVDSSEYQRHVLGIIAGYLKARDKGLKITSDDHCDLACKILDLTYQVLNEECPHYYDRSQLAEVWLHLKEKS